MARQRECLSLFFPNQKEIDKEQCCSPLENGSGGWGIFNSLFGWQNSATYGSVISYNVYWIAVILGFLYLAWKESKEGKKPAVPRDSQLESDKESGHTEMAGKASSGGVLVGTSESRAD